MRGKVVNLCLGFLNLLFGILIVIYTTNVPQDRTLLTVQEIGVVKIILNVIYIVMFSISLLDLIQSFNHKNDSTFNIAYILGIFTISFWYFKQPIIAIFSLLSGIIILFKSIKENLIELNSTTGISISIVLMSAIVVLIFCSLNYASFGEKIKNKENENEQEYKEDYFKYVTELNEYTDVYINVKKDGKFGYINQNGEVVIDFIYDYASPFIKIYSYNKQFYVALVCENGSSSVILKNMRKVLSYRTETDNDNYNAKYQELKNIYENILQQTEPMEYEIENYAINKNKVPIYRGLDTENEKIYDYSSEYNLIVSQSNMGRNDIYELSKKDNESEKITLDATNLDYDDDYLYIFSNGYIPFYNISKSTQGWFTNYGKRNEIIGKAHILDFFEDGRLILRNLKDGSIYFSDTNGEKLSDSYYDICICRDGRYIVKGEDNYFKVIDDEYNPVFEKEYVVMNPRLVSAGLYLVLNSVDNIKFNDYGYAIMDWTLLNHDGEEIATNIEYIYDINLKLDKSKSIFEDSYLIFTTELKKLKSEFVGDKFYYKK